MKKIIVVAMLVICFFNNIQVVAFALDQTFEAKSVILFEPTTKQVLHEKNAHDKLPPASVTKVMTMLLIYEAIKDGKITWEDKVTISEHAANMGGSQIFLEEGQTQTVKDLTKSIVIASANDAAVAMAEHIAGTEEAFVVLMNQRSKELGMDNTTFINACGLDAEGHETTAHDIALMSGELIVNFPEIKETALTWMDTITHETRRGQETFGLTNTNKMVRSYSGITGLKTGSTSSALFCISATAEKDDLQLVSVILGAPNSKTRFNEAGRLLDYGFANYTRVRGDATGSPKGKVPIHKGSVNEASIVVKDEINVIVPKGSGIKLESEVETLANVTAPQKKGTKVGEVIYKAEGKEVGRASLVLENDVQKAGVGHMMKKIISTWSE